MKVKNVSKGVPFEAVMRKIVHVTNSCSFSESIEKCILFIQNRKEHSHFKKTQNC